MQKQIIAIIEHNHVPSAHERLVLQIVEWLTDLLSGLARYELTIYITFSTCKQILLTGHSVGGSKYPITSATLATRSGLTVRVQSSTWGNTFFFSLLFFHP